MLTPGWQCQDQIERQDTQLVSELKERRKRHHVVGVRSAVRSNGSFMACMASSRVSRGRLTQYPALIPASPLWKRLILALRYQAALSLLPSPLPTYRQCLLPLGQCAVLNFGHTLKGKGGEPKEMRSGQRRHWRGEGKRSREESWGIYRRPWQWPSQRHLWAYTAPF